MTFAITEKNKRNLDISGQNPSLQKDLITECFPLVGSDHHYSYTRALHFYANLNLASTNQQNTIAHRTNTEIYDFVETNVGSVKRKRLD